MISYGVSSSPCGTDKVNGRRTRNLAIITDRPDYTRFTLLEGGYPYNYGMPRTIVYLSSPWHLYLLRGTRGNESEIALRTWKSECWRSGYNSDELLSVTTTSLQAHCIVADLLQGKFVTILLMLACPRLKFQDGVGRNSRLSSAALWPLCGRAFLCAPQNSGPRALFTAGERSFGRPN